MQVVPVQRILDRTMAYFLTLKDGPLVREVRLYDVTSRLMQLGVRRA